MAWAVKQIGPRTWEYSLFLSAYGAVVGTARSKALAKVELAIQQADLVGQPLSSVAIAAMRSHPQEVASEYPDTIAEQLKGRDA